MSSLVDPLIVAHVTLVLTTYVIGGLVMRGSNFRAWFDDLDIPCVPKNGYFYAISWFTLYGLQIAARAVTFNAVLATGEPPGTEGFYSDEGGITAMSTLYCVETFMNIIWIPLFFLLHLDALSILVVLADAGVSAAAAVIALHHGLPLIFFLLLPYTLYLLLALTFTIITMRAKIQAGIGRPPFALLPTTAKAKAGSKGQEKMEKNHRRLRRHTQNLVYDPALKNTRKTDLRTTPREQRK
jgi:tryptophan-rich sensory protein